MTTVALPARHRPVRVTTKPGFERIAGVLMIDSAKDDELLDALYVPRVLGDRPGVTPQFGSEFLGDVGGVGTIADDLGTYEDDQFGSR